MLGTYRAHTPEVSETFLCQADLPQWKWGPLIHSQATLSPWSIDTDLLTALISVTYHAALYINSKPYSIMELLTSRLVRVLYRSWGFWEDFSHFAPGCPSLCKLRLYQYKQVRSATIGPFACSGVSRPKWISVAKSAKLLKSVTEKRDPKSIFHFRSRSATESMRTKFRYRK